MPRITVGIRLRPDGDAVAHEGLTYRQDSGSIDINVNGTKQEFVFDNVFNESVSQGDIFNNTAQSLADEVIEGYNGCIFAYGQTGAGKTYTMSGPTEMDANYDARGLCMRVAGYLFDCARKIQTDTLSLRLSVLEIYNESLTDLLVEPAVNNIGFNSSVNPNNNGPTLHSKLTIVDTANGVIVPGLHILPISSYNEAYNILLEAQGNRAVAEHQLNRKSSRSHVIYTYYITRTKFNIQENSHNSSSRSMHAVNDNDVEVVQSKLHLVDLAGSERQNKTGSTGSIMKEANHINKSLSYLEQVVIALTQNKRDHIPYRQSKLTYLLKDTLGGNCNTYMIACIWPSRNHSWETLSTLRFAARMKCIETHPVRNSLVSGKDGQSSGGGAINTKLLQQIEALKKELVMRDFIHHSLMTQNNLKQNGDVAVNTVRNNNTADSWMPELSKGQKIKTFKQCVNLVQTTDTSSSSSVSSDDLSLIESSVEIQTLSHAHLIIGTLKTALLDIGKTHNIDIAKAVANTILARNSGYSDKLQDLLTGNLGGDKGGISGNGDSELNIETGLDSSVLQIKQPLSSAKKGKSKVITSSPLRSVDLNGSKDKNSSVEGGIDHDSYDPPYSDQLPRNQHTQEETAQAFELFKLDQGAKQNASYEDAKEALKLTKSRQAEIITLLNHLKATIDKLNQNITDISVSQDDTIDEQREATKIEFQQELEAAKKAYRAAHNELKLCKDQIVETQSLKKRAMTSLLTIFHDYYDNL